MIGIEVSEIDCCYCEENLIKWLEQHREEINKFLASDIRDAKEVHMHQLGKIGKVKLSLSIAEK